MNLLSKKPTAAAPDTSTETTEKTEAPGRPEEFKFAGGTLPYSFRFTADWRPIVAKSQATFATAEELAALREANEKLKVFAAHINATGPDIERRERKALRAEYERNPSKENFDRMNKAAELDRGTMRTRGREARLSIKQSRKNLLAEIDPIIRTIIQRARLAVESERDALARAEAATAESYGVPYVWSETVGALDGAARSLSYFVLGLGNVDLTKALAGIVTI